MELYAHQREALAVATSRNVLLCSAGRVGKTFLAAMRVREWLLSTNALDPSARVCVAIAPSTAMRTALWREIVRLCSEPVWVEELSHGSAGLAEDLARHVRLDPSPVITQATTTTSDVPPQLVRIAIVSPKIFQSVLRKQWIGVRDIGLLVFEGADEIHETAPSLYRQVLEPVPTAGGAVHRVPSIFATASTPASSLVWDPLQNPLFRHIHVLHMMPVVPTDVHDALHDHTTPSFPLLLSEPFDAVDTTLNPAESLSCPVRDFLLGENEKKIDYVRLFRMEMEMGNSAAVYNDKKKQERVNRFILDAESVYQHLGLWCLLKYVELELQFNLQACLVEDVDNINRRRRQHLLEQQRQNNPSLAAVSNEGDDEIGDDDDDGGAEDEDAPSVRDSETLAALVDAAASNLDEAKLNKVKGIVKVLAMLSAAAIKVGAHAATPRLKKVAMTTRCRLSNTRSSAVQRPENDSSSTAPRCWVFVERRVHCTVVAEYLSFVLSDLGLSPCCSMLGHSNARVVGSLHFSSYLKITTMLKDGSTSVLVTTSIANTSQRIRHEPPQCDLVVVMDETQEPEKLLDYCRRAYPRGGVVKCIIPSVVGETRKFQVLVRKLNETIQLEPPVERSHHFNESVPAAPARTTISHPKTPTTNTTLQNSGNDMISNLPSTISTTPTIKPVQVIRAGARSSAAGSAVTYEIINKDTGAILNLETSIGILSKFCETLPGLDTYDRRPQYYIKRHQITGPGMAASLKAMKKKKLKYNCNLDDKIDDIKAQAEARDAAENENDDVDMETGKTDESYSSSGRFQFTAKLRLPVMIGVKKEIGSPKVSSDVEAKAIVAFKACQELIKRGLLDRRFCSTLECDTPPIGSGEGGASSSNDTTVYIDDEDPQTATQSLTDLSAQNSYDLPPVSAAELGLPTVRSLMAAATSATATTTDNDGEIPSNTTDATVSMCFYGIEGIRFAILSSKELYTGNTNTGWRYDFATSDVMEPIVNRVTLQTKATTVRLTKTELEQVLHFHLITMRLACMKGDDAMREIDIKGGHVWNEFSEQNDKGYLVVPSRVAGDDPHDLELDWAYVREIVGQPLLVDCWPLPRREDWPSDEWVCVPKFRRNVCYVVRAVTDQTAGDVVKPVAESDASWAAHLKTKPVAGVPIFGRWHKRDQVKDADPDQPLLHGVQVPEIVPLIRRVMQRHHDEASIAQTKSKFQERFLLPEFTSLLRLTKTRFFEAMGIVPLLYEFERKCQMSHLMSRIGMEVDLKSLDDATSKPAYERLEILGDTFLKLETSWHLFEHRADITEEGQLTQLRRDIIRNDRLNMFALAKDLHHYMLYPAEIEQHPFKFWKPSCMGKTPENIVAPSKWIADVLEAMCGAYLENHGEVGARHFLQWVGVTVPGDRYVFKSAYHPFCNPEDRYADDSATTLAQQRALGFRVERSDDVVDRLVAMQQRLKYTFTNKLLLLEAMTHPSVGTLTITMDASRKSQPWRGNYERLEYLGDAVIEYLTLSYAYLNYKTWLPGSLSQWKGATVSNDALGKTAIMCFGIDECLLSGALKMDRESLSIVAGLERRYVRDPALTRHTQALERVVSSSRRPPSAHSKRKALPPATALNSLGLPKLFADVFEALVAAVFIDSGYDLRVVRDVFLGPLLSVVATDAYAYVCRESGLPMANDPLFRDDDFMGELRLSSDDEDD